jgi:hypothetical protein
MIPIGKKLTELQIFLLFRQYRNKEATIDNWVDKLQKTADSNAKEELYIEFAKDAAIVLGSKSNKSKVQKLLDALAAYFDNKKQKDNKEQKNDTDNKEQTDNKELIANTMLKADGTTPLTKHLSFLCNFLEGKEINELLSAYINKFENIQAFINLLKELDKKVPLDEKVTFSEKYALFNEPKQGEVKAFDNECAGQIAKELRILASIEKMKPNLQNAKRQLYKAAIETLGVPEDSDKLSNDWLAKNLLLSAEEKEIIARRDEVNPFRNFIANNVIESRRFMYLIRYTKPKTARALMRNRKIVHYVLATCKMFTFTIRKSISIISICPMPMKKKRIKIEKLMHLLIILSSFHSIHC